MYNFDEDGSLNDDTSADSAPACSRSDEMDHESINDNDSVDIRSCSTECGREAHSYSWENTHSRRQKL